MKDRAITIVELPFDDAAPCQGASRAPQALREAGLASRLKELGYKIEEKTSEPWQSKASDQLDSVLTFAELTCSRLSEVYSQGHFPLIIGGDHSISIATVSSAVKHFKSIAGPNFKLGVLWVDAHPDLNTFQTSPSGNIHGMSMAALLGSGENSLIDINNCGRGKVKPECVAFLGLRSIDPGEKALIERLKLKTFFMQDVNELGIEAVCDEALKLLEKNCDGIVLSFDIDVCDPSIAPGVSTPEQGGLSFEAAKTLMARVAKCKKLIAAEIVEYNPLNDVEQITAELAIELTATLLGN